MSKKSNLSVQIYETLLTSLQRGEVGPEDRLVDVSLAADLGVSRMPVREALTRLAHEGYLAGSTRGFMLASITGEDAQEIFEMRRLLEPRAVASATMRLDAETIDRIADAHAAAGRAVTGSDVTAFMDAIRAFRNLWLDAIPNKRLADTVTRTLAQIDAIQRLSFADPASRLIVFGSLSTLLAAFRNRDSLAAHDTVANLIERGRDIFLAIRPLSTSPTDPIETGE